MAIHFGNDNIKDIYVGSNKIKEVYYGSEKVWGTQPAVQDGYWMHKDTGVKTYFGADADFINNGVMGRPDWLFDAVEIKLCSGINDFELTEVEIGGSTVYMCLVFVDINLETGEGGNDVLQNIDISNTLVNTIGSFAFYSCTSLTSFNLLEGMTSIERNAFHNCSSLTSITLPDSLTSIGNNAFWNCTSLSLVTSLPTIPPSLGDNVFTGTHANLAIKVPAQSVNDYKTAENWSDYAFIISSIEEPPITDGYWKHYQTGVITPIYLTDSNITSGTEWRRPSWADLASEIKLPTGITDIMYDSVPMAGLANFPELLTLDIPETVSNYNTNFLGNTQKLTKIIIRRTTPVTGGYVALGPNVGDLAAFDGLYVPEESVNVYKTTSPWSAFSAFIKAIV